MLCLPVSLCTLPVSFLCLPVSFLWHRVDVVSTHALCVCPCLFCVCPCRFVSRSPFFPLLFVSSPRWCPTKPLAPLYQNGRKNLRKRKSLLNFRWQMFGRWWQWVAIPIGQLAKPVATLRGACASAQAIVWARVQIGVPLCVCVCVRAMCMCVRVRVCGRPCLCERHAWTFLRLGPRATGLGPRARVPGQRPGPRA